ncbi:MAG: hypothetical protein RJB66_2182 [Pseudomonadota bacterium]|jgi:hypothetical protein
MNHKAMMKSLMVAVLSLGLLAGCSASNDQDKIGDAQFCLDELPVTGLSAAQRKTRVNTCLDKLGTLSSKDASLIRCSGNFLIEGFGDPGRIVDAMSSLSNQGGGSGTVGMMSFLKFKSMGVSETATEAEDSVLANETFSYCSDAGNPGYVMIASFARIATNLSGVADVLADGQLDAAEVTQLINAGTPEVIGQTAIIAYEASCSGGENANKELCSQLSGSMNSGNASAIGQALLNAWKTP